MNAMRVHKLTLKAKMTVLLLIQCQHREEIEIQHNQEAMEYMYLAHF